MKEAEHDACCGQEHANTKEEQARCAGAACGCGHAHEHVHEHGEEKSEWFLLVFGAVCFVLVLLADRFLMAQSPQWTRALCYAVPYLLLGWETVTDSLKKIPKGDFMDENFLMTVATVGAFAIGEYPEAVFVVLFFDIGECFEHIATARSRKSIAGLASLCPEQVTVLKDGMPVSVSPREVKAGTLLLVKPGERVALDCEVVQGTASLDTSAVTGESAPRGVKAGDAVVSGCISLDGALTLRTVRDYGDSTVPKMLETIEKSMENKAEAEKFITRFAKIYTPIVVAAAVAVAVIPSLVTGEWLTWVYRALTFLMVSCPCALVVSIPLAFYAGVGSISRGGILLKGSRHVQTLARCDMAVFDKTGTLTTGTFSLMKVLPGADVEERELLTLAALGESASSHPLARAVMQEAQLTQADKERLGEIREQAGFGVAAQIDGETVFIGSERWMASNGIDCPTPQEEGTWIFVGAQGKYLGALMFADQIRPQTKEALDALRAAGVSHFAMLTGDRAGAAAFTARQLGIDTVFSGLLPGEKAEKLEQIAAAQKQQNACSRVMFVGDGINDAPVLLQADVGIAMGQFGADIAMQAADGVLMGEMHALVKAVRTAKKTMRIVWQNITLILLVKFGVLLASAFGYAPMYLAIFADVCTLVLAILNALRLLRYSASR